MEIFNEVAVISVSFLTFAFTPMLDSPEGRNAIGWAVIGIILVNFFGTMIAIIHDMGQ